MSKLRSPFHPWSTNFGKTAVTFQTGTPMTVTGNDSSSGESGRGVLASASPSGIFGSQISPGGPGGRQPPAFFGKEGLRQ